jgi:hypothetical protein
MNKDINYFNTLDEFLTSNHNGNSTYLLYAGEDCNFDLSKLQETKINCYGAIFPEIIFNNKNYKSGLLSYELPLNSSALIIENISNFKSKTILEGYASIITIIDGLSPYISSFLEQLFESLDANSELIGGGAGKLTLKQEPVIFNNNEIFQDAALLIGFKNQIHVGVRHGWNYLEGPLIASSTNKNILHQIDYKSAYTTYKDIVEKDSGLVLDEDNFFQIAKSYPLGIIKFDQEVIVRDPIVKDKDSLVLVGDMVQNSVINILKGNKDSLVESAGLACMEAKKSCNQEFEKVIMFDCISRVLFLEENFNEELNEVQNQTNNKPIFGALTLGEIVNEGDIHINFFNKTCVIGLLC